MPPEVQSLAAIFSSFPGLGPKSALRIVFYLLKKDGQFIKEFSAALLNLYQNVGYCPNCGALKSQKEPCEFCSSKRDFTALCVVEQPSDIYLIESTGEFRGIYHVLMGVLSPLDGVFPEDLRLNELKNRVLASPDLQEIIIATNPSVEGLATANYIAQMLKELPHLKITRLASGLALGSQMEYVNKETLSLALRNRVAVG